MNVISVNVSALSVERRVADRSRPPEQLLSLSRVTNSTDDTVLYCIPPENSPLLLFARICSSRDLDQVPDPGDL